VDAPLVEAGLGPLVDTFVDSEHWVRCGVRRDALVNAAGAAAASGGDPVSLYRSHRGPIHALASAKFREGRVAEDGLVLVSSVDLNS
jgi:hypothetical protein